jgi:hypothetical protein
MCGTPEINTDPEAFIDEAPVEFDVDALLESQGYEWDGDIFTPVNPHFSLDDRDEVEFDF